LPDDPFANFKLTKKNVEGTALSEMELRSIKKKVFATSRLDVVKDILVFRYYTGLAFVDVQN
jgi:hypothetical protein